ncbi:MAG: divergent polysaccharide deacetylase family protein [Deltaproteobacteria bacterium]|nr:divergent polysaccharide deacetylase family protein [Deltaproteobacteria bacterium]MBW2219387.1 divergent polysaccharide deacetylase family protein [Deltaproteobacteria bacterium]
MTKKNNRRKSAKRSGKKGSDFKTNILRALSGIVLLLTLVVLAGITARYLLFPEKKGMVKPVTEVSGKNKTYADMPEFEVFPGPEEELKEKEVISHSISKQRKPRIAIIIDDLGYDSSMAGKFLNLNQNITLAILPHSPLQRKIATQAHQKGIEVMLHLPMEPVEYPAIKPGPGALLSSMTTDQMIRQLEEDIDAVPFISGVNNHMGSKITAISTRMYQVFSILKKKDLYFVDSRTTKDTLCRSSARLLKIKFAERDVFLDNIRDPEAIRKQINRLVRRACANGEAVGIAHPYKITYTILKEELLNIQKKACLVPVSEVVHFTGHVPEV